MSNKRCCEINFKLEETSNLKFNSDLIYVQGGGSYRPLSEKPQVNYKVLESGNNSLDYLGIQEEIVDISPQDIDNMIYGG